MAAPYDHTPDESALTLADKWVEEHTSWEPKSLGYIIARLDRLRLWDNTGEIEYNRLRNSAEAWFTCADPYDGA